MSTPQVMPFGVKATQAIQNIQQKIPVGTARWNDLLGPAHAKMFAVAGATKIDLVTDLHKAVSNAVAEQQTLSQFRKSFDEIVQKHGWTYKGKRGWRTALIYHTNMRSAAMAGKWQRIQDSASTHPYLRYVAVMDNSTRPEHERLNGTTLPIDDPFWDTYYPPNGYRCRCDVYACSINDLNRRGWTIDKSPEITYRDMQDIETGEIIGTTAKGTDPGWDHNVGKSWLAPELALGRKLATMPASIQSQAINSTITPEYNQLLIEQWQRWLNKPALKRSFQPVNYFNGQTYAAIASEQLLQSVAILAPSTLNSTWPLHWLAQLPAKINQYQAILKDKTSGCLILLTREMSSGKAGIITIKPDQYYHTQPVNIIHSLEVIEPNTLNNSDRYQLLKGSLKEI